VELRASERNEALGFLEKQDVMMVMDVAVERDKVETEMRLKCWSLVALANE
jgi:hypothetical protein